MPRSVLLIFVLVMVAAACGSDDGGGGGAAAEDAAAEADSYPEQSIRWIVAFDPGGGSDVEFRRLQPHLEEALGVSIEVEYRPGGGGGVGWAELVNAEPDGYTVGGIVLPHIVLQPLLQDDTGFQTDDFDLITLNTQAPQAMVVSADDPAFSSFEEFAEAARSGSVDVGASARFNLTHVIVTELIQDGLQANYVATEEGATAVTTGVAGGDFPVGMFGANNAVGNEEVEVIAVSSEERYEALPDVPTFKELGIDVTGITAWGVAAPPGTPLEIRQKLADAILEAMESEDVQTSMEEEGQEAIGLGPEESEQFLSDMVASYTEIADDLEE